MIGSNDELGHSCENNGPGAAEVNQELHKRRHCSTGNHIRFGTEFEKTYSLFPNVSHVLGIIFCTVKKIDYYGNNFEKYFCELCFEKFCF